MALHVPPALALLFACAAALLCPQALAFVQDPKVLLKRHAGRLQPGRARKSLLQSAVHSDSGRLQVSRRLLLWALGRHQGPEQSSSGGNGVVDVNASCIGSGYFVDWGSSGMKVFRVHDVNSYSLTESAAIPGSMQEFKLPGMGIYTPAHEIRKTLDGLVDRLWGLVGNRMIILSTAGMRLKPDLANKTWSTVRQWSDTHVGLFPSCGNATDNDDCKTLSGSEEAALAMRAALRVAQRSPHIEKWGDSQRLGFADAGGASLQVGLRGPEVDDCFGDLGELDDHFDTARANVTEVEGVRTLLLSFLSVANESCADGAICDYGVGGLDQMRARFDHYLKAKGMRGNPCLSVHTKLEGSKRCRFFNSESCVVDRYGGEISHLPPGNLSLDSFMRKAECKRQVASFMADDLVLSRWSKSPSCASLASKAPKWMLLSSFARDTQLGADVSHRETFENVRQAASALDYATADESARGEEGMLLSSVLLVHFLEALQVSYTAEVQGVHANWAEEAMRQRGLAVGWPRQCTSAASSCGMLWGVLALALALNLFLAP